MTEKIKDRLTGWLLAAVMSLLTLTASGVGWLIVQNHSRMNSMDSKIEVLQLDVNGLKNISSNLVEAYNGKVEKDKEQDKEILELWKCSGRGAKSNILKQ